MNEALTKEKWGLAGGLCQRSWEAFYDLEWLLAASPMFSRMGQIKSRTLEEALFSRSVEF